MSYPLLTLHRMEYCFRLVWEAATASLVFILQQTSVHGRTTSCYKTGWKTQPGVLLHLRQGLLLDHSEMKEFLPGSPLSHLDYGSRNKDLSLVSGMCIAAITISMVLLPCAVSSTWTWVNQLLTLVHDWDDTGPPPTCTSRP